MGMGKVIVSAALLWILALFGTLFFSFCPGIMLLIFTKSTDHVPLKILSIEDGTVLKSFNHLIHWNKIDFIEQFNEKLLVKQERDNLQILDVRNSEVTEVNRTDFMTPSAFIFLYENQLFLTFRNSRCLEFSRGACYFILGPPLVAP